MLRFADLTNLIISATVVPLELVICFCLLIIEKVLLTKSRDFSTFFNYEAFQKAKLKMIMSIYSHPVN